MKKIILCLFLIISLFFCVNVYAQESNTIEIPVTQDSGTATTSAQSPAQDLAPVQTSTQTVSSALSCVKVGTPDESLKASVCKEATTSQQGTSGPVIREYCGDEDLQGNPVLCYKPGYVFYCQGDPQWGRICDLASAGCGPTTMAMVLSAYGDTITPPDMDSIFRQRGWRACGDKPSYMQSAIQNLLPEMGYEYHALGAPLNLQRAQEFLNAGYLIIGSTNGHIFVIDGVDPAQNILRLRDPGRCENKDGVYRSASAPWGGQPLMYSYAVKKKAN